MSEIFALEGSDPHDQLLLLNSKVASLQTHNLFNVLIQYLDDVRLIHIQQQENQPQDQRKEK